MRLRHILLASSLLLVGCAEPPPVVDSREVLWQRYANQPLDKLLLEWGSPDAETTLTSGARLVTYRRSTTYDAGSYREYTNACEVNFLARPPDFRIDDVAMEGSARECSLLAQGRTGQARYNYMPPHYPHAYHYPYSYGRFRF